MFMILASTAIEFISKNADSIVRVRTQSGIKYFKSVRMLSNAGSN